MTADPGPRSGAGEDAMVLKLVKRDRMESGGRSCDLRYYEGRTPRGGRRYSCEVALGTADRIIIDGDSLPGLESRVWRLLPATIDCRNLSHG